MYLVFVIYCCSYFYVICLSPLCYMIWWLAWCIFFFLYIYIFLSCEQSCDLILFYVYKGRVMYVVIGWWRASKLETSPVVRTYIKKYFYISGAMVCPHWFFGSQISIAIFLILFIFSKADLVANNFTDGQVVIKRLNTWHILYLTTQCF